LNDLILFWSSGRQLLVQLWGKDHNFNVL